MSILPKIDFHKIKEPSVRFLFLVWLFFALLTTMAFYFQIRALNDIDVPTHIGAGMVITASIYAAVRVQRGREVLALALVPFILWELIEVGLAGSSPAGSFLFRLFSETLGNHLQDVTMDILGFFVFQVMTGKRF